MAIGQGSVIEITDIQRLDEAISRSRSGEVSDGTTVTVSAIVGSLCIFSWHDRSNYKGGVYVGCIGYGISQIAVNSHNGGTTSVTGNSDELTLTTNADNGFVWKLVCIGGLWYL